MIGFKIFVEYYRTFCKQVLGTADVQRCDFQIMLDEKLLLLCKSCTSIPELIQWRQTLFIRRKWQKRACDRVAIELPRSARFIYEAVARHTLRFVVKATSRALPAELQDGIYAALLAMRGIEVPCHAASNAWEPIDITTLWVGRKARMFRVCCPYPADLFGNQRKYDYFCNVSDYIRWSNVEHKYIYFHAERSTKRITGAVVVLQGRKDLNQGQVIYRRCKKDALQPISDDAEFDLLPFGSYCQVSPIRAGEEDWKVERELVTDLRMFEQEESSKLDDLDSDELAEMSDLSEIE